MKKRPVKKGQTSRRQLRPETVMMIKQGFVGLGLFLFIGLVLTGVWHGSRVESLTINDVEVIGGETVAHETVLAAANDVLDGTYGRLVPKRFAWTYPKTEIETAVGSIPRIHNVQVERTDRRVISIIFDEYRPHALWCPEEEGSPCLFLDHTGYAFTEAPLLRGEVFVRYVTLGREPTVGETLVERQALRDIEWFIEELKTQLSLYAVRVEVDRVGDVFYTLSGGGELKVSMKESKDDTFDNLATILSSEEFADLEPGSFKYIDLRFGNKVFVNEELADPEVETASSTEEAGEASLARPYEQQ